MERLKNTSWPNTDASLIIEALSIPNVAAADGAKNQPASDQRQLSQIEREVVGKFKRKLSEAKEFSESIWRSSKLRIEDANVEALGTRLSQIESKIAVRKNELVNTHRVALQNAQDKWQKATKELQSFQIREKREGAPHYPENKMPLYASIAIIFLIESIINANFYAKANVLGLLGGLIAAVTVAFVFLLLAEIFSLSIREMFHISPIRKGLGLFAFLIALGLTVSAALGAGHYRTAAESNAFEAETIAWGRFLETPLQVGGFSSLILTIISLLICAGYTALLLKREDLYPGYSSRARKEEEKREIYEDELSELTDQIRRERESIEIEIRAVEAEIKDARNSAFSPPDPVPIIAYFKSWVSQAESDAQTVLERYRQINRQVRSDEPPEYFNEDFEFQASEKELHLSGKDVYEKKCEQMLDEMNQLFPKIEKVILLASEELNPTAVLGRLDDAQI